MIATAGHVGSIDTNHRGFRLSLGNRMRLVIKFLLEKKDSLQRDRNSILGEINLIEPKQKPLLVWCGLEAAVAASLYFFFFLI